MSKHDAAMSRLSDASLVEMIEATPNHATAEAALCERFRRRVYLYGLRHLGSHSDAEDLAHDVLATVVQRVREGALKEPDKLGSFVLGMARMVVLGRRRVEARRTKILARYQDPRSDAGNDDFSPAAPTDLARVGECLGRLGDRDRAVLLLSFYSELSADAIGRDLGMEAAHVRVVRHRALGRMRTCLKGFEEDA